MIKISRLLYVLIVIALWAAFLLSSVELSLTISTSGWAEWGDWSAGCPRQCHQENGYQKRTRECYFCVTPGSCTKTASTGTPCVGGGDPDETRMCYEPTCTGAGIFDGSWTAWTKSSDCILPKNAPFCQGYQVDQVGMRRYERTCSGSTRIPKHKCTDVTGHGTTVKRNCSLPCPARNGGWSQWGRWSRCSVTCGKGSYVRRRKCMDPAPMGAGKECAGKAEHSAGCQIDVSCPIDGGWSGWSEWSCSVTCGGGTAKRKRRCDNPPPEPGGGSYCDGNSTDIQHSCNNAACPEVGVITTSILSSKIKAKIWKTLQTADTSYQIKEGQNLQIQCPTDVVEMVRKDFPSAELVWTKNTNALDVDPKRVVNYKGQLMFSSLIPGDSGVYVCEIEYEPPLSQTIGIYSVVVTSEKPTLKAPKKSMTEFACNAEPFTDLLSSITRTWFHNGTKFHSVVAGDVDEEEVIDEKNADRVKGDGDMLEVKEVIAEDSGVWECRVTDNPTQRVWTTSWIRLNVLPELSGWETFSSNPAQFGAVIGAVIGVVLIVCLIFMCRSKPDVDEAEKAVEKMKLLEGQVEKDGELGAEEENGGEVEDENEEDDWAEEENMEEGEMYNQRGYYYQKVKAHTNYGDNM